ncbi:T9SS type A sorting domain-containing protein, partial [candidate division WOR-3 bacterium]|nr:T9SS type A sorting domain-containing protein [candidate division WOR-3 bacterium]
SMPRMPSGRPVRNGGALAWGNGRAWALKGNKTLEFWSYDPGQALQRVVPNRTRAICSAEPNPGRRGLGFRVFPNPLGSSHLDVRFDLPVTMTPVLCLRDVSGRVMVSQEIHGCRAGALQLDLAGLPSGVYLAALEVGDVTVVEKLVIRR